MDPGERQRAGACSPHAALPVLVGDARLAVVAECSSAVAQEVAEADAEIAISGFENDCDPVARAVPFHPSLLTVGDSPTVGLRLAGFIVQLRHFVLPRTIRPMLVGRERELAQLRDRLERGDTVVLLGEAGVGKTALLRAAAAACGRRVHEGGGLATLSWLPYLPVERALGRKLPVGDSAWVASEIEREVADGVLLLDDLHWTDRETRALLPLLHGRIALATAVRRGDPGTGPALAELASLEIDPFELEPLLEDDATVLVSRLSPSLSKATVRKIVSQAGGNPLLLEELTNHGGLTDSLRLALAARLRQLAPAARRGMGLLSLAGHALPESVIGDGARELVDSGLVLKADGGLVVRHALLAETLAGELDERERCELHELLAHLLSTPGEAARHFAAAGKRELARAAALRAAKASALPGERGRHLAVAATCTDGAEADALRLTAARALIEAHDHDGVEALLDSIESGDRLVQAEVGLLRYEMLVSAMDFPAARAEWQEAMDLAAGSGSHIETRLRVEAGRIAFLLDLDPHAVETAEAGYALARQRRQHELLAQYILGSAQVYGRDPSWRASLEQAIAAAGRAGEFSIEYRATNNLVMGLVLNGDLERARTVALKAEEAANARHARRWGQRMAVWLCGIDWHQGALAGALERGDLLISEVSETLDRALATKYVGHTLVDLGRLAEARQLVEGVATEMDTRDGPPRDGSQEILAEALTILARADYWGGRTREAVSTAERARGLFGSGSSSDTISLASVVGAWSRLELGLSIELAPAGAASPLSQAASVEIEAVEQLARDRALLASNRFEEAAALWERRSFGGLLRCRWAQGEALRRAGATSNAIGVLEEAERLARESGYAGILARTERTLRLCGVRRSARRGRAESGLTARERGVLTLVGEGCSNQEIARRLGIGRPTVARLVQSASRKLGAETRAQAASLAARE